MDLDTATWEQLLALRRGASPEDQDRIAPYEHRAYARERVKDDPLNAPGLAVAIPAYQLAKALRLVGSRTRPSLDQVTQGYKGIWEGLTQ